MTNQIREQMSALLDGELPPDEVGLLVRPGTEQQPRLAANGNGGAVVTLASLPVGGSSPTPAQNQRIASYLVAHGQYASPIGRRNLWSSAPAAETGITRVAPEAQVADLPEGAANPHDGTEGPVAEVEEWDPFEDED